jgi:capsule polysaccharide export protein KpsE/RkpR
VADTLMEHLPPSGWGDVARQGDIAVLKTDIADLKTDVATLNTDVAALKTEMAGVKTEIVVLGASVEGLRTEMNVKIDALRTSIVNEVNANVTDKLNSQMRWMIGLFATQFLALAAIAIR